MTGTARLMLLDTASLYFRAFYALPSSITAPDGTPVNAARGLLDMIGRLVREYEPARLIACWDDDWRPAWRVELIPGYKAHRVVETVSGGPDVEDAPDALVAQLPLLRELLTLLGVPIVGVADHEADDVIGTLAEISTIPVDIVTGDRDLFQLVDDARDVRVISTVRGMAELEIVTDAVIRARYAVSAVQYADFATLRGDASDGLPGVPGVGEKTAAALLATHGDLDRVRSAAAEGEGMTKAVAAKVVAASGYLDVAPAVVRVARDLDLALPPAPLVPLSASRRAELEELAERWNLTAAAERVIEALDAVAAQ